MGGGRERRRIKQNEERVASGGFLKSARTPGDCGIKNARQKTLWRRLELPCEFGGHHVPVGRLEKLRSFDRQCVQMGEVWRNHRVVAQVSGSPFAGSDDGNYGRVLRGSGAD